MFSWVINVIQICPEIDFRKKNDFRSISIAFWTDGVCYTQIPVLLPLNFKTP